MTAETSSQTAAELGVNEITDVLPAWIPVLDIDSAAIALSHDRAAEIELWTSLELNHIANPTDAEVAAVRHYAEAKAIANCPAPGAHWTETEAANDKARAAYRAVQNAKRAAGRPVVVVRRKTFGRAEYTR